MDFNLKNYQIFKLKKYLKNTDFFFLFHSAKLNLNQWTVTEQNLKKLKLDYYKTLNGTTVKTLKNSIYRNFSSVVSSFVIFINSKFKRTEFDFDVLMKNLKSSFFLISLKLNNKIYTPAQLKNVKSLSYKKNIFNLHNSLDRRLKTSYRLTSKSEKIISK